MFWRNRGTDEKLQRWVIVTEFHFHFRTSKREKEEFTKGHYYIRRPNSIIHTGSLLYSIRFEFSLMEANFGTRIESSRLRMIN